MKYLLNRCVKLYNTRPCYPKSQNLPSIKLNESSLFSACGIDYIRSLCTQDVYNNQQEDQYQLFKCYVILYVGSVADASAKTFVNSLKEC